MWARDDVTGIEFDVPVYHIGTRYSFTEGEATEDRIRFLEELLLEVKRSYGQVKSLEGMIARLSQNLDSNMLIFFPSFNLSCPTRTLLSVILDEGPSSNKG
ncbi:hypothetical protein [Pyrococcus kukulkanii]|uniref:Uncharacterized protein n=1 Tax=Pyrococcus kukulkanii TaxID=1609559 RepID=A0ABV4T6F0_9EURY